MCNVSITHYSKPINCMWKINYCCLFSFNLAFTLIINLALFFKFSFLSPFFFAFFSVPHSSILFMRSIFSKSYPFSSTLQETIVPPPNAPFCHPFSVPPKHVHAVLGHYPSYLCPLLSLMQVKSMSVTFLSLLIAGDFWISSLTLFHRCSPLPFF